MSGTTAAGRSGLEFLESIRVEYGRPQRLLLHWERMQAALRAHNLEGISFSGLTSIVEQVLSGVRSGVAGVGPQSSEAARVAQVDRESTTDRASAAVALSQARLTPRRPGAGDRRSSLRLGGGPGRYKLRLLYGRRMWRATLERYSPAGVVGAAVVPGSHIRYAHKYADRSELDEAGARIGPRATAVYERNGLITDSWYANVLLRYRGAWYTPEKPLLEGVMRRSLLDSVAGERASVHTCEIAANDLWRFESISFINAMLDPGDLVLTTEDVMRLP